MAQDFFAHSLGGTFTKISSEITLQANKIGKSSLQILFLVDYKIQTRNGTSIFDEFF